MAFLGATSVVMAILAHSMGISLILFRTGSMEPSIPAGSMTITTEVDAEQINVGDVLTVQTPDMNMPVTHRVIAVNDPETVRDLLHQGHTYWTTDGERDWQHKLTFGTTGTDSRADVERELTVEDVKAGHVAVVEMQGDANDSPDSRPYVVSTAQATMAHIPGIAPFVAQLSNPRVLMLIAIVASLLVAWAFWPRTEGSERKPPEQVNPATEDARA
ncbi:S26 family signal peptidase [Nesterenkonia rhizosphaerae]